MPKRKLNTEITITANKKSLKNITGIDKDLSLKTTADKGCQTEQIKDETNHYLLLELIANDLESSDIILKSVDGDQVDGFRETIKLLVEKLFEQIKDSIKMMLLDLTTKSESLLKR